MRVALLARVVEPVVARILTRDMRGRLAGLKRSAETTDILQHLPPRSQP